ncbi:helix-turn-helix domain-containing protein [Gilvibacter sp.]|uniref:helix-turn-helix domain-containing protein n=1 Tax=Gilvibacter sp. TaxID=2729997 RepID=UPI0025B7F529|nr:helix-turn-helix domain-containing protein [Gilvibacter sp.]NQX78735.1 AraC family transcriptional regulator [Gilvibacter sp.]
MKTTTFTEFSTDALLKIGDQQVLKEFDSPKQIGLYSFIWALESGVEIIVDSEPILLQANQILALTPIQYVQFNSDGALRVYQFNREFYCIKDHDKTVGCDGDLFFGNDYIPLVNLSQEEQEKFELLHQIFLEEMDNQDRVQAEMLRMLMARFIIKTTRLLNAGDHPQQHKKKSDLLRKFNMLVETHFKNEHSVKFYAEQMFKSPKTLANSFAKFNSTPLQIIHGRIVLEAKRLLTYTDLSSKEIAYELGFDDPAHLSKLFKKNTGMPPSAFKASKETLSA